MSNKDESSDSGKDKDVEDVDAKLPGDGNGVDENSRSDDDAALPVEVEAAKQAAAERQESAREDDAAAVEAGAPDQAVEKQAAADVDLAEQAPEAGTEAAAEPEKSAAAEEETTAGKHRDEPPPASPPRRRRSWFGFFNFLLILALGGAGGYYWWLEQQAAGERQVALDEIRAEIETRAELADFSRLDGALGSLRSEIGTLGNKVGTLETEQQGLRESTETLYELFGRDRADWQLAEVEYLMRVAQHKLILEDDFAGAALTLQAASDRLGRTGDPGMLPVRVTISEEVAALKTRERPDLVGMTLTLARLARQVPALEPGFAPRIDETGDGLPQVSPPEDWRDRLSAFIESLVEVRHESAPPTAVEAEVADVSETLEDNLKLARWAVLDRDARQYAELIDRSLRLLREYYDLDNAANHDFMSELQALQKMQLRPQKPDITGSLRQLREIMSRRENAPEPATGTSETSDG